MLQLFLWTNYSLRSRRKHVAMNWSNSCGGDWGSVCFASWYERWTLALPCAVVTQQVSQHLWKEWRGNISDRDPSSDGCLTHWDPPVLYARIQHLQFLESLVSSLAWAQTNGARMERSLFWNFIVENHVTQSGLREPWDVTIPYFANQHLFNWIFFFPVHFAALLRTLKHVSPKKIS